MRPSASPFRPCATGWGVRELTNPLAKIGKYEILSVIGRGGMGVVYKARDPFLNRLVAIKMIVGATPGLVKRFDVEARSTASLQHPNIVTIYDFGDQDGSPYLVMEYLEGVSLDSVLTSRADSLSLANKLNICIEICNGLNYAHERGIIHRDIKPANIMLLNAGGVKIVDFGIARIGSTGISRTEIVGTIHYMSPEQFQNQPLDRRTDIFSTGVVLYQLLTGAVPFQAEGEAAIMYQIIHDDPPPLRKYLQEFPSELDGIVTKALAKDRELRYPSGREFALDLIAVAEKQRQSEVTQWMKRAETAVQRTEWNKAEDCLRQVLSIDGRHTQAHQLLSQIQVKIRQQRQSEQVRQLRLQADQAFLERRYDDALTIVDQALGLDETNEALTSLQKSIHEARTRAARFRSVLRKAEEAHQAGDLDEAAEAIGEALAIEPQETSAKALQVIILKQVREEERQQRMRKLLDSARDQISERNLTGALETLKQAELLDPGSVELISLLKIVNTARKEQGRKNEIENLTQGIEAALAREDYDGAIVIARQGLDRYPQDQSLSKLKILAEKEQRRLQLKAYTREQTLAANSLMESGKTLDALSLAEKALQNVPGDLQLETIRGLAKNRLASEKDDRKRQLIASARELVSAEQFSAAARLLEGAKVEFSYSDEVESLLQLSRDGQKRVESIASIVAEAQQLLNRGNPQRAVEFLEKKALEVPDARLFDLLHSARSRWQQFHAELRKTIQEGTRTLEQFGGLKSLEYLSLQPAEYRESIEFQALSESAKQRATWELLVGELAQTTEPDAQIRLAEAAFRQSPNSEDVKSKLAELRAHKERISGISARAKAFEAKRQYADAAAELERLSQIYPAFPNLESDITRLSRLQQERLSAEVHRQSEQFHLELQSAIEEGKRILQQHGAAEAERYVSAQPAKYREVPEYRTFTALIAQQLACEALDQELARTPDPVAQERLVEKALRLDSTNQQIKKRLAEVHNRAEKVIEVAGKAEQLAKGQRFAEAAKEWEKLGRLCPSYPELESQIRRLRALEQDRIAESARREQEEIQRGLQRVLNEAERILQERGASEASKYIGAQARKYRGSAELRALSEVVAARAAFDALERELLRKPDPDVQLRLAENALLQSPENTSIKDKLASVRNRKDRIEAIASRARALEVARQFDEAAQELGKMRQIYAQYPRLEREIQRLERLDREAKQSAARSTVPANGELSDALGATVIMGQGGGAVPLVPSLEIGVPAEVSTSGHQSDARPTRPLLERPLFAVAIVAVIAAGFVAYRLMAPPARILIRLKPDPADSTLIVDGVSCAIPCQRALAPGKHKIEAEHDGYTKLTDYFQVDRDSPPDIRVTLSPVVQSVSGGTMAATHEQPETTPKIQGQVNTEKPGPRLPRVDKPVAPAVPASGKEVIAAAKNVQPTAPATEPTKPPTPPPYGRLELSRPVIERGESSELTWNIQNATIVRLDGVAVIASGSTKVSPSETTTYELVAIGSGGEHDFDATVVVNIPAPKVKTADTLPVASQDQNAISDLLQRYAASYSNKDAKALHELWPGIPKEKLKLVKESYKVNARVSFSDLQLIREPDGRVRVLCTQTTDSTQLKVPTPKQFTLFVNQKGGRWVIDYIPIQ